MTVIKHYYWTDGDIPSPGQICEAFNLLREFCPEIENEDSPVSKAFHRIVCNKEFTETDVIILTDYAYNQARTAEDKYNREPFCKAPWSEAVILAANNIRGVMVGLDNLCKNHPHL